MEWKAKRPIVEIAAEWIAACCLGGAAGFALAKLAPWGPLAAGAIGVAVALGVLQGFGQLGRPRVGFAFDPVEFVDEDEAWALSEEEEEGEALLLDDPIPGPAESRVLRLFTAAPVAADAVEPIAEPGEMLARIEDFLGGSRDNVTRIAPAPAATATSAEASAALHAALAEIRASLGR